MTRVIFCNIYKGSYILHISYFNHSLLIFKTRYNCAAKVKITSYLHLLDTFVLAGCNLWTRKENTVCDMLFCCQLY